MLSIYDTEVVDLMVFPLISQRSVIPDEKRAQQESTLATETSLLPGK